MTAKRDLLAHHPLLAKPAPETVLEARRADDPIPVESTRACCNDTRSAGGNWWLRADGSPYVP
jgi:hypothetical protein